MERATGVTPAMQSLILKGLLLRDSEECPREGSTVMLVARQLSPEEALEREKEGEEEQQVLGLVEYVMSVRSVLYFKRGRHCGSGCVKWESAE